VSDIDMTSLACGRLSSIGIKQDQVHSIIDTVQLWIDNNGAEWTIQRLKALKNMYIHQLAGDKRFRSPFIACHPSGKPKGAFRSLWECDVRKPKQVQRALNALMCYSSLLSREVTHNQWEKFRSSVEEPEPASIELVAEFSGIRSSRRDPRFLEQSMNHDLGSFPLSPSRRVPVFLGGDMKSVPEDQIHKWFWNHYHQPLLDELPGNQFNTGFRSWKERLTGLVSQRPPVLETPDRYVGKVSFIQEPGYKLRAVANPNRLLQWYLEPLKREVWRFLQEIPQDCTYDQDKGIATVQGWLKEGHSCHSVDLSDATNNFPRSDQFRLLRSRIHDLNAGLLIDAFEAASEMPWAVRDPITREIREIRWAKGQPLGLGPSFGTFALAHHEVMKGISRDYVILGDDIVIRDDAPAAEYRSMMASLGCPVSPEKTLSSDRLAEFAGKLVSSERVFPQYKWRSVSDRSFLDVARNSGPKSLALLRPRQRRVATALAEIPDFMGGLGWNPTGRPLEDRILAALDLFGDPDDADIRYMQRAQSRRFHRALQLGVTRSVTDPSHVPGYSDQLLPGKAEGPNMLSQYLGRMRFPDVLVTDKEVLPDYVWDMPSDPRGRTTLDRYESILREKDRRTRAVDDGSLGRSLF
jgi:hypothetical protein